MSDPAAAAPRCCFEVFTLFPAAIEGFSSAGLLGKAIEQGRVQVRCTDFRDFTTDRHRTVDDAPFGGGAGMVLAPGPVVRMLDQVDDRAARAEGTAAPRRVLLSPAGRPFDQAAAQRFASGSGLVLLCGRYEGIDDRVREHWVDECLSLGDFVLGGGEVAALAIIEAVSRLVEGVVGNPDSVRDDSFGGAGDAGLLEHPHYTRPADFRGHAVPAVLLGGDHEAIARWRHRQALLRTWALRPDLRPRQRLRPRHPIHLAVSPQARPDAAALTAVVRRHGVAGLAVVGAGPDELPAWPEATGGRAPVAIFADPKALRRRLRRGGTGEPRLVVLAHAPPPASSLAPVCERPEVLLDLLAEAPGEPLGPVVLWTGPGPVPPGLPVHAIYAPTDAAADDLTPGEDPADSSGLALGDVIAQSPGPRPRTAALAHAALTQLLDRG
ncbi:MAG: tRNA (guanosine(37)-N1)-methyltransferase TrmD [Myxococcales bacterium]|nr:tRNA (guanosine(37)-N1)-methyltransferase TrmD [Myxococcales bacterium]